MSPATPATSATSAGFDASNAWPAAVRVAYPVLTNACNASSDSSAMRP